MDFIRSEKEYFIKLFSVLAFLFGLYVLANHFFYGLDIIMHVVFVLLWNHQREKLNAIQSTLQAVAERGVEPLPRDAAGDE